MKSLIFLISISLSHAWLDLNTFPNLYPFDRELQRSVLNPVLCQKQLEYLRNNDSLLLLEFLDAGSRLPKGIFGGNLRDTGSFHQCLGINTYLGDASVEGKYCTINIPLAQNFSPATIEAEQQSPQWSTHIAALAAHLDVPLNRAAIGKSDLIRKYLAFAPYLTTSSGSRENGALAAAEVQLALCIPKACTTHEVINHALNVSALGFQYKDNLCRLPDDKPWVAADYVAIVVFSTLAVLVVLSTSYDMYHLLWLERDFQDQHVFRVFSAYTNVSMVMDSSSKPASLQCLDGVRALAIFWVILGHVFYGAIFVVYNLLDVMEWQTSLRSIWITSAPITVDTFFMLSGLLLVYISMAKYTRMGLLRNLHVFYLSRLLRMFPVLAVVVLFEASLFNRVSDGAFWPIAGNGVHACRAFWWSTLLHLQNFVNPLAACLPVTWYLAIDAQLHIISPLILFWVLRGTKATCWAALVGGFVASVSVATAYIFLTDVHRDYFVYYYANILTRSPPFFVGMIVGYCLRVYRDKPFEMSKVLSVCTSTLSVVMLLLVIYVNFLKDYSSFSRDWVDDVAGNSIDSLSRSVWSAALGWIIFACVNGYGGPINYFLCLDIWKIPARISYSMYIVHFSIVMAYYSSMIENYYFSVGSTMLMFLSCSAVTVIVSIVLAALVELPFATLFKVLLDKVTLTHENPSSLKRLGPVDNDEANGDGHGDEAYVSVEGASPAKNNL